MAVAGRSWRRRARASKRTDPEGRSLEGYGRMTSARSSATRSSWSAEQKAPGSREAPSREETCHLVRPTQGEDLVLVPRMTSVGGGCSMSGSESDMWSRNQIRIVSTRASRPRPRKTCGGSAYRGGLRRSSQATSTQSWPRKVRRLGAVVESLKHEQLRLGFCFLGGGGWGGGGFFSLFRGGGVCSLFFWSFFFFGGSAGVLTARGERESGQPKVFRRRDARSRPTAYINVDRVARIRG